MEKGTHPLPNHEEVETNAQHPRSCPSFSTLVYRGFDYSISKNTYISSLDFFLYYIHSIFLLLKISCPLFLRIFRASYSRNWEKEFLNLLEPNRKSPTELTSTTDISKLRIRCLLESQLRVTPWNKKPMEIHTQQSRVHHFSLSYGHQATSQLHNSMHSPPCLPARIEDLRHTQPHACTRTHGNR